MNNFSQWCVVALLEAQMGSNGYKVDLFKCKTYLVSRYPVPLPLTLLPSPQKRRGEPRSIDHDNDSVHTNINNSHNPPLHLPSLHNCNAISTPPTHRTLDMETWRSSHLHLQMEQLSIITVRCIISSLNLQPVTPLLYLRVYLTV